MPRGRAPTSDVTGDRSRCPDGSTPRPPLSPTECSPTASTTALTPPRSGSISTGQDKKAKIRLNGATHWRWVCNELPTLKQMIEKSPAFVDSRHAFRDVKRRLRAINSRPAPSLAFPSLDSDFLLRLLPKRPVCEYWISQYLETYGRLFDFMHPKALLSTTEEMWHGPSPPRATSITLVLLTIAVAMQNDDDHRLLGRRIAQQLQDFFYSTGILQRPSFEVFQNLCLRVLLKYISVSDSDKFDDVASMLGQTQQMAFAMGLHRDPASFSTITPYEAGLRTRLWSNFFRLALEYSVQSGTPLMIRTEDVDCPPSPNAGWDDGSEEVTDPPAAEGSSVWTESTFGIVLYRIAAIAASLLQDMCSPGRKPSLETGREIQHRFHQILTNMPRCLQHESQATNKMEKLQQILISVLVHRSSLLLYLHLLVDDATPDAYHRTLLFDIWDNSCSILSSIRAVSADPDQWTMGYQFLWADACRAVFCEALVLRRIRPQDELFTLSSTCQHIVIPLQHTFNQNLSYLSDLWRQKVRLGPNVAKIYLYLRVLSVVSPVAMSTDQQVRSRHNLLASGVRTALQSVEEVKRIAMDQQHRQQQKNHRQSINHQLPVSMGAPSTEEVFRPASVPVVSPAVRDFSDAAWADGSPSHLATAEETHRPGFGVGPFPFDGLGYDMASQSPHQYSFDSANTTPTDLLAQWQFDQSLPVLAQKSRVGNVGDANAAAISPLMTTPDGSIFMPWTDEVGEMGAFSTLR